MIRDKLKAMNANFSEVNDLTIEQHEEMIADEGVDLVYLPGCSVKKGDPGRDDFLKKMAEYYFTLDGLQRIKQKSGKTIGLMHSLPRNEGEFDFSIDASEHELYFKQIGFSVPQFHRVYNHVYELSLFLRKKYENSGHHKNVPTTFL